MGIDVEYKEFKKQDPTLDEFEAKLKQFCMLDEDIDLMKQRHQISALMLKNTSLAKSLKELANKWKESYAKELHSQAFKKLETVSEMIKVTTKRLNREVTEGDIDALGYVMETLKEVRAKQSEIELEFTPITHMYAILDQYLPMIMDKEEQDARSMMRSSWYKLLAESEQRQEELTGKQFLVNLCRVAHVRHGMGGEGRMNDRRSNNVRAG